MTAFLSLTYHSVANRRQLNRQGREQVFYMVLCTFYVQQQYTFTLLQKSVPSKGMVGHFNKQNPLRIWLVYEGLCWRSANLWPSPKIAFMYQDKGATCKEDQERMPTISSKNNFHVLRKRGSSRQLTAASHSISYQQTPSKAAGHSGSCQENQPVKLPGHLGASKGSAAGS